MFLDIALDSDEIKVLAKALKSYTAEGKTTEQFQKDFGCKLIMDDMDYGIKGVKFQNDSYKTMFMLKYNS